MTVYLNQNCHIGDFQIFLLVHIVEQFKLFIIYKIRAMAKKRRLTGFPKNGHVGNCEVTRFKNCTIIDYVLDLVLVRSEVTQPSCCVRSFLSTWRGDKVMLILLLGFVFFTKTFTSSIEFLEVNTSHALFHFYQI